jgi:PAS domain S-box-containing protein
MAKNETPEQYQQAIEEKKQALALLEEKLALLENKHRLLAEESEDVLFKTDLNFRISYISPAIEKILGYSPQEYAQKSWQELLCPSSLTQVQEAIQIKPLNSGQTDVFRITLKCYHYNGEIHALNFTVIRLANAQGQIEGYMGLIKSLQEKLDTQKELEKLANIAKYTINGVIITDAQGHTEWINEGFERLSGYSLQEMKGKRPGHLLQGPNTDQSQVNVIRRAIRQKESFCVEIVNYHKTGREYWVRIDGRPLSDATGQVQQFIAIQTDISEAKERERQIAHISERLKLATQAADLGVWEWQLEAQSLHWTKQQGSEELVVFSGAVQDFFGLLSKFSKGIFLEILQNATKGILQPEMTFSLYIGQELRIIRGYFLLNYHADGRPKSLIGVTTDITRLKEQEDEKQKLIEDLTAHNKSLEDFGYIISHNLRAPIANIIGLVHIYDHAQAQSETNRKILEGLSQSAQRLDTVVQDLNDILSLQRNAESQKQKVLLNQVIREVEDMLLLQVEQTNALIDYELEVNELFTFKSLFFSVIQNLISNALKYRHPERSPIVHIKSYKKGAKVLIEVKDNGLGIDLARTHDKLFKLYKRFHGHVEGKGIGLYLVKKHIEEMNGSIQVKSELGQGTTFIITIPL